MSLQARIEAIIFAAPQPLMAKAIVTVLDDAAVSIEQVDAVCQQLSQHYRGRAGGFELVDNGGYRFQTVSSAATMLRRLGQSYTRPLSRAALETLAVVAYRQPLTRAEIEYLRGVESGNLVRTPTRTRAARLRRTQGQWCRQAAAVCGRAALPAGVRLA